MQRQSENSYRFASASSTNHALPIPPGRPPQRILAPVTTLDTNQARAASRPALSSHLNAYNPGPGSSPSRTYSSSPSQAVHPKAEHRPLSAARQRQYAHDISGMDQRAPASAYSSLSSNSSFPVHSTATQAALTAKISEEQRRKQDQLEMQMSQAYVQNKHTASFDTHQTALLQKRTAEQRSAALEKGKLNPLDMTVSQRQIAANQAALQHSQFVQAPPPRQLQRPTTPTRVFSSQSSSTETSRVLPSRQPESAFEPSHQNRFNLSNSSGKNLAQAAVPTLPLNASQLSFTHSVDAVRSQQPLRPNSALYANLNSSAVSATSAKAANASSMMNSTFSSNSASSTASLPSLQSPRTGVAVRTSVVNASPARPMSARSLYASSSSSSHSRRQPVGLQNLGNTCFMNAVLQSLFASEPFISYFLDGNFKREAASGPNMLSSAFARLLDNAWGPGSRGSVLTPDAVKSQLGRRNPIFQGYAQQDSHELLRIFLDDIHEELCRAKRPCPFSFDDGKEHERSICENASRMWENFLARNGSIVSDLFTGQFCSTVSCGTCGYTSRCFDPFMDLSVPLPKAAATSTSSFQFSNMFGQSKASTSKNADLMDCFNIMFGQEELSGSDSWFCAKCKKDRTATKKLSLMRIPALLVVHLKRFEGGRAYRTKLSNHISFPIKGLSLAEFCPPDARERLEAASYDLYATVNHHGSIDGGHYVAHMQVQHFSDDLYRFHGAALFLNHALQMGNAWYCGDDSRVSPKSGPPVDPSSYILFYRRTAGPM